MSPYDSVFNILSMAEGKIYGHYFAIYCALYKWNGHIFVKDSVMDLVPKVKAYTFA